MQAQAKPKPSTQFEPSQPRLKFPTKEIEPPPPSSDPKPSNQIKKPTKQPPSNPKPTDLKTTQKRKEPNSMSKPESQPPPKRPTIKIKHPQPAPIIPPKPDSPSNIQEFDVVILDIVTPQPSPSLALPPQTPQHSPKLASPPMSKKEVLHWLWQRRSPWHSLGRRLS